MTSHTDIVDLPLAQQAAFADEQCKRHVRDACHVSTTAGGDDDDVVSFGNLAYMCLHAPTLYRPALLSRMASKIEVYRRRRHQLQTLLFSLCSLGAAACVVVVYRQLLYCRGG